MFLKLTSAAVMGLDCLPVIVEVDITKGQTNFAIVGLADTSLKEAKEIQREQDIILSQYI